MTQSVLIRVETERYSAAPLTDLELLESRIIEPAGLTYIKTPVWVREMNMGAHVLSIYYFDMYHDDVGFLWVHVGRIGNTHWLKYNYTIPHDLPAMDPEPEVEQTSLF